MSEYTPTTEIIRRCYVFGDVNYDGTLTTLVHVANAEFDRWLAAHDEQVRAAERERCAQIAEAMGPVDMALAGSHAGHDVADAIRAVPAEQKESN